VGGIASKGKHCIEFLGVLEYLSQVERDISLITVVAFRILVDVVAQSVEHREMGLLITPTQ